MYSRLSIGLLVVALCGISPALGQPANAGSEDGEDSRVTIPFKDESIARAVEILAELTDHTIEVLGPIPDWQVTLVLREVTLKESLERIFYPSSFVIEWGVDRRLIIRLLTDDSRQADQTDGAPGVAETIIFQPAGQADDRPPGLAEEFPVTIADLDSAVSYMPQSDFKSLQAFPPGASDEVPITIGELEDTASPTARPDMSGLPAFPPGASDEVPITIGELEDTTSPAARPDMSGLPAFPPAGIGPGK